MTNSTSWLREPIHLGVGGLRIHCLANWLSGRGRPIWPGVIPLLCGIEAESNLHLTVVAYEPWVLAIREKKELPCSFVLSAASAIGHFANHNLYIYIHVRVLHPLILRYCFSLAPWNAGSSTSLARLQPLSPFVTPQPLKPLTAAGCQVQPCAPSQAKLWQRQELLKVSDLAEGFLEGIEIEMYWDILICLEAELQQSLDAAAIYLPSESGEGSGRQPDGSRPRWDRPMVKLFEGPAHFKTSCSSDCRTDQEMMRSEK